MKICDSCGAYNSDERNFCVDCNEKLGERLSDAQEIRVREDVGEKLEEMYNKRDPLYVSRFDKFLGLTAAIGAVLGVVLIIIGKLGQRNFDFLWIGFIFLLLAAIEALVPQVLWAIEKLRLSFYIHDADDAEPSDFYLFCRKASVIISLVVGVVILAVALLDFRNPPVRKYISDIAADKNAGMSSYTGAYVNANPEKWQKIIDADDYAVNIFISELESAESTGLEETLMMDAIIEITDMEDMYYTTKDDFLFAYRTYGWEDEE